MLSLPPQHIVDLYVWIDDLIIKAEKYLAKGGRPTLLSSSETITLLVWNVLVLHQKNLKDIHRFTQTYLRKEFPQTIAYSSFVRHCHRVTPLMFGILECLLEKKSPTIFMDSTMLPVCKLKRADSHKVAKNMAHLGKNHQGWHYGFKLHACIPEKNTNGSCPHLSQCA